MRRALKRSAQPAPVPASSVTSALFTSPPNIRAVARHYRVEHSRRDAGARLPAPQAQSNSIGMSRRLMTDWPAVVDPPRARTMQQAFAARLWCTKPFLLAMHWLRDKAGGD